MEGQKQMEYCLSILYVAMDELGMIWCMDAFMERRYKDWKFWVTFTISMAFSFYLFNFIVSGITVLHILIAYAMFLSGPIYSLRLQVLHFWCWWYCCIVLFPISSRLW